MDQCCIFSVNVLIFWKMDPHYHSCCYVFHHLFIPMFIYSNAYIFQQICISTRMYYKTHVFQHLCIPELLWIPTTIYSRTIVYSSFCYVFHKFLCIPIQECGSDVEKCTVACSCFLRLCLVMKK